MIKVAILLYGLFRSKYAPLFWKHMLPKGDVFVFGTFTKIPRTPRSHDVKLENEVVFNGINASNYWSIVNQHVYDSNIQLKQISAAYINKSRHQVWQHNMPTVSNAIRVLFVLNSLRDLFQVYDSNYTHLILSRVDLLFTRVVFKSIFKYNDVITPDYATFGGINDRFLAGPKSLVLCLMNRIHVWKRTGHLSERLLLETFKYCNIINKKLPVGYTRRVRGGEIVHHPQYRKQKNCKLDMVQKINSALLPFLMKERCLQ